MIAASCDSAKTPLLDLVTRADDTVLQRIKSARAQSITRQLNLLRHGVVAESHQEEPSKWAADELRKEGSV